MKTHVTVEALTNRIGLNCPDLHFVLYLFIPQNLTAHLRPKPLYIK